MDEQQMRAMRATVLLTLLAETLQVDQLKSWPALADAYKKLMEESLKEEKTEEMKARWAETEGQIENMELNSKK